MTIVAPLQPIVYRAPGAGQLLAPRVSHLFVLGAVLGLLLPSLSFFMLEREVYEALAFHQLRPQVEKQFGFTAQRTPYGSRTAEYGPFTIVSLVPNGPFASSGAHVGDVSASGFHHGDHAWALYGRLAAADGQPVELRFFRGPSFSEVLYITVPPTAR
jgi:hypothetical protein